jgi:predicted TIM-barrel fold metal-dependent hydrolase
MRHGDEDHKSRAGKLSRREFMTVTSLGSMGLVMGGAVPSTGIAATNNVATSLPVPLIDVHCHVFNGKDLPVWSFLRIVFCECYPPQREAALPSPRCVSCVFPALAVAQVQRLAPSAKKELRDLRNGMLPEPVPATGFTIEQFEIIIEALLGEPETMRKPGRELHDLFKQICKNHQIEDKAVNEFKESIRNEAGLRRDQKWPLENKQLETAAKSLSESKLPNGRRLRWIGLFIHKRGALVNRLQEFYAHENLETALFVPGLVDFSKWLNEEVGSASSLELQVELIGKLSRRAVPPVHGYVAFDPMRAVFHRHKRDRIDPLELVHHAIKDHGFVGVKLYPPMGFIPLENVTHRPPEFAYFIVRGLPNGINIRAELDDVLRKLYAYCMKNDVPIMAHASASIGSQGTYEKFADPGNWAYALQEFDRLRLNVAHFGSFYGARGDDYTGTFEWHFGMLLGNYCRAKLYADLSYLEEILTKKPDDLERIGKGFRKFIDEFDPKVEHLMFGSDWTMLGLVEGHEKYARQMADFLSGYVGLNEQQLRNLFRNNARSFLGLERGTQALDRLKSFYGSEYAGKFDKLCRSLGL